MRKNIHRKLTNFDNLLDFRKFDVQKYAVDQDDYIVNRDANFEQQLQTYVLNDIKRGILEENRTGYTVNGLELRVKLVLRGWDAAQSSILPKNWENFTLRGQDGDNTPVRQYLFKVNKAGLSLGAEIGSGQTEGVDAVGEAEVSEFEFGARSITASANNGSVEILDSKFSKPPFYDGYFNTGSTNLITTKNETMAETGYSQYRILLLKYWDVVADPLWLDVDWANAFLYPPEESIDLYGPVTVTKQNIAPPENDPDEFADITTEVAMFKQTKIRLTAPLLDKIFRQVDILYDKVITLDANKPYFTLDEVWKLNETARWLDDSHLPIENGIVMFIYDNPSSRFNPRTYTNKIVNGVDVHSYKPQANICHVDLCAEYYYTQPIN